MEHQDQGRPLLNFAHANGLPAGTYTKMLDALSTHFTVVAKPVFGMDPKYPLQSGWGPQTDELIAWLEAQCRQTGQSGAYCVGHSFGATISLLAAYKRPDLIHGVVILDPPTITGWSSFLFWVLEKINPELTDKHSPARFSKKRRDTWSDRADAARQLVKKPFYAAFDPQCFDDYIRYGLTDTADGVSLTIPRTTEVEVFRTNPPWFWLGPRKPPAVPVQMAIGQTSEFNTTGMGNRFARQIKVPLTLRQGSHMFPLEYPLETAAFIHQSIAGFKNSHK